MPFDSGRPGSSAEGHQKLRYVELNGRSDRPGPARDPGEPPPIRRMAAPMLRSRQTAVAKKIPKVRGLLCALGCRRACSQAHANPRGGPVSSDMGLEPCRQPRGRTSAHPHAEAALSTGWTSEGPIEVARLRSAIRARDLVEYEIIRPACTSACARTTTSCSRQARSAKQSARSSPRCCRHHQVHRVLRSRVPSA